MIEVVSYSLEGNLQNGFCLIFINFNLLLMDNKTQELTCKDTKSTFQWIYFQWIYEYQILYISTKPL